MTAQSMKDLQKGRRIYSYYSKKQVLFAAFLVRELRIISVQDDQSGLRGKRDYAKRAQFLVTVVIQVSGDWGFYQHWRKKKVFVYLMLIMSQVLYQILHKLSILLNLQCRNFINFRKVCLCTHRFPNVSLVPLIWHAKFIIYFQIYQCCQVYCVFSNLPVSLLHVLEVRIKRT